MLVEFTNSVKVGILILELLDSEKKILLGINKNKNVIGKLISIFTLMI